MSSSFTSIVFCTFVYLMWRFLMKFKWLISLVMHFKVLVPSFHLNLKPIFWLTLAFGRSSDTESSCFTFGTCCRSSSTELSSRTFFTLLCCGVQVVPMLTIWNMDLYLVQTLCYIIYQSAASLYLVPVPCSAKSRHSRSLETSFWYHYSKKWSRNLWSSVNLYFWMWRLATLLKFIITEAVAWMILFLKVIFMSVISKFHKVPNNVHSGDVVVGMRWPYRQIALLPPMLICFAWQVRVISTPCWTVKEGSVLMLLHVESRVLHSDSEIMVHYNDKWLVSTGKASWFVSIVPVLRFLRWETNAPTGC